MIIIKKGKLMNKSESIGKLTEALAKAQSGYNALIKDSTNPFFKSKYADLAACLDCVREPLSQNNLAVIQITHIINEKTIMLETVLSHSSGEWISGEYPVNPTKPDAQGIGAGLTYARRYALSAILGLAAENDDDGNLASGITVIPQVTKPAAAKQTGAGKTPTTNTAYSKNAYTDETIKRVEKLEKDGLKGKECLKKFLPQYSETGVDVKNLSDLDDAGMNKLINFIENQIPIGM